MGLEINEKGWLRGARHCPSPNYNARPEAVSIDLLVIHNISLPPGEFGGADVEALFMNTLDNSKHPYYQTVIKDMKVSAHLFIRRTGEAVQFVSFLDRAWHAGVSSFEGQAQCNDFSIGIELEGTDTEAFTPAQYDTLAEVTRLLMQHYPITPSRITGHEDIAPGRKTDPGPCFNWARYMEMLS